MAVLTAQSTIGDWLDDETGRASLEQLLKQSGSDVNSLDPLRQLPLQQLVEMSQGAMPQSVLDDLVRSVNDGELPTVEQKLAWQEQITPGRFEGKTVIVTGAASGIGHATASRIIREGGKVIAVDISAEKLAEFAATVPQGQIVEVAADVSKQEDIDRIVAAAGESVHGLANVAGINDDFSPIDETSDAVWDRVIGINLTGVFKLTRAVVPLMLAAGTGSIVNIASEAGLRGNAAGNAYTTSKHAVVGLTRSAAFMYSQRGLRVNAVAPGAVATGIPMPDNVSQTGMARLQAFHPLLPGVSTAAQLAASITFLLSDDGVNINGVILPSDGGWSVQ